jgi:hypothetical protein
MTSRSAAQNRPKRATKVPYRLDGVGVHEDAADFGHVTSLGERVGKRLDESARGDIAPRPRPSRS